MAAHLARTQLVADPLALYDAQHLIDMVQSVAGALLKVAPVYVRDGASGSPRELTPAELEGAAVSDAGSLLTLADGRHFSAITIKRRDLRQAIAILRALGVPGLRPAGADGAQKPVAPRSDQIFELLAQIEDLLARPPVPPNIHTLLVSIARDAGDGRVANLAMQLMSALQESAAERVAALRVELRAALEGTARSR